MLFDTASRTFLQRSSYVPSSLSLLRKASSPPAATKASSSCYYNGTRSISSSSTPSSIQKALASLKGQHFMSIGQLSKDELNGLLDLSHHYKQQYDNGSTEKPLLGNSVSMIFQKRSTRTRVSAETGMHLLGGHALFLGPSDIQLGVNESLKDTALVLSRFNSLILARVFAHSDVQQLAEHATVPVINALSDLHHPLQTLADIMAMQQHFGSDQLQGKTVSWVGDGNNVLHDLMLGSAILGMNVQIATPTGYEPNADILEKTKQIAAANGAKITTTTVAEEAVRGAHAVFTDTWISMGQEEESAKRIQQFEGYQVNNALMSKADPNAVFLHCLPRHPEEVHDEVFYGKQSIVFPEAENRMWTVMAVMAAQLGKV